MTIELVVDRSHDTLAMAILDEGALVDLWSVDAGPAAVEDRLFLARVTGIEPAVDGAFLDHGGAQAGYITGKDARFRRGLSKKVSIRHCLEDGEWLVVQGLRAAEGDKGARFTTDLRLPGPHLVYRPHGDEITAARGIRPVDRDTATARGRSLLETTGAAGGLVLRRSALACDAATLQAELQDLVAAWQRLAALPRVADRKAGPLGWGPSPLARLLWRAFELGPARLIVADDALKAEARRLLEALPEPSRPALEALTGKAGAFAQTGVDAALAEAMAREIPLPKGGRLIVEETAACVAIDVDGGGRPALEVDLEAAAVIGRLVRLRNLGGTLVVDFVDLAGKAHRQRLEEALKRAFRGDPLPVQIYPMSPLGIVQISRAKRGGQPLRALGRICPTCGGSGWTATS
jgi:ribonuclease E/ribonuclease G